jgi:hypothetical protein
LFDNTLGKTVNNRVLGSADLRDAPELSTASQLSEAFRAGIIQVLEPNDKALRKLPAKSQHALNALYRRLRDGDLAHRRSRFTKEEFEKLFKESHPDGAAPTKRDFEAYWRLAEVEEADYIIRSVNMINRFVERGYGQAAKVNGEFVPVKKIARNQVTDDLLYDVRSKGQINKKSLPDDTQIFEVEKPVDGKYKYIVRSDEIRVIEPEDVMGYNVGGTRMNPNGNWIIVGEDGRQLKSLFTAFSLKQAKSAETELQNIQRAIRSGDKNIDDVVRSNNKWNPSIDSYDALKKWADDIGWDLNRKVGVKSRSDRIQPSETLSDDLYEGMRFDDYLRSDLARNDRVLMEYGGGS